MGLVKSLWSVEFLGFALAYFYLTGPLLIVWELFRPELSVPILLLFIGWAFSLARSVATQPVARPPVLSHFVSILALLALCVGWISLSGIGGYAVCRWDYVKHNLVFSFLLQQKLPIETQLQGRDFIFHYSTAYYITPVRLKQALQTLTGHANLKPILLVTYSAVLFVAVRMLAGMAAVPALIIFLVFSLVGGLDLAGMKAFGVKGDIVATLPGLGIGIPRNIEWWGVPGAPQSPTMHLYYAPQHFFAALIGTTLIIAFMRSSRQAATALANVAVTIAASAFWSAYVTIGLAMLALTKILIDPGGISRWRERGLAPLLTAWGWVAIAFATALAIAASIFLIAAVPLSPPHLLVNRKNAPLWLLTYALNYAPCILALLLTCWPHAWKPTGGKAKRDLGHIRLTFASCLLASAALLLVAHGAFNDWGIRTTLPLWLALAIAIAQVLWIGLKWAYLTVFLVVVVLSSAASLAEVAISAVVPSYCAPYGVFSLEDMGPLAFQYEGRRKSMLYRYFARSR